MGVPSRAVRRPGVPGGEGALGGPSSAAVPGRRRATQPSTLRCRARATAIAPGGTSWVITEPAAV
nr:hypothetical protein GCM10020241_28930 [Streptoalloteichus tenebrarius]